MQQVISAKLHVLPQVLSIGETVEEVSDSGFLPNAPTLKVQLLADDSMLQVGQSSPYCLLLYFCCFTSCLFAPSLQHTCSVWVFTIVGALDMSAMLPELRHAESGD